MTQLTEPAIAAGYENAKKIIALQLDELTDGGQRQVSASQFPEIVRFETELPNEISLIGWLQSQEDDNKVYWSDRDNGFETAGVGICCGLLAEEQNECPTVLRVISDIQSKCSDDIRFYGGIQFPTVGRANGTDTDWQKFGAGRFVLPRFELVRRNGTVILVCNVDLQDNACSISKVQSDLNQLVFTAPEHEQKIGRFELRTDLPGYQGWSATIGEIISDFARGNIEKIVLARQTRFDFKRPCNAMALLERLINSTTHCYHYFFQPLEGVAFLGASPEQLYRRRGMEIQSEAIAGTRLRGGSPEEDETLGNELLTSEKDIREHRYVVQNIKAVFEKICESLDFDQTLSLLKLARVQHLLTHFSGRLRPGITDAEIIGLLHPTSAVGGHPSDTAQKRIAQSEPFDRGWYAGAVGWLSEDAAEFAVAIRSGLVHDRCLKLFSGAGIVEGSTPQGEWDEIESKIGSFLNAVAD